MPPRLVTPNYQIIGRGDIIVELIDNPQADQVFAKFQKVIEEIWQQGQHETGGKLFDGDLLNFIGVARHRQTIKVTAHFTQYKNWFAQRRRPDLPLGIAVVGVSGIMILPENARRYVVLAKRAKSVTDYPGWFELVPSGHIEREDVDCQGKIDFKSALVSEFVEETGLPRQCIAEVAGFALVRDIPYNVYDIGCRLVLRTKPESVVRALAGSDEYGEPTCVAVEDLNKFMKENAANIVPTSLAIINAWRRTTTLPVSSYERC